MEWVGEEGGRGGQVGPAAGGPRQTPSAGRSGSSAGSCSLPTPGEEEKKKINLLQQRA